MTAGIEIDTSNLSRRVSQILSHFNERQILEAIGNRQLRWINDNFRQEGIETKWPPLKPATIARRRRRSSKPLQDTGQLRRSAVSEVQGDAVLVGVVDGTEFKDVRLRGSKTVGATTHMTIGEVAAIHHRGAPSAGIPARPLLPQRETAEALAVEVINAIFARIFGQK